MNSGEDVKDPLVNIASEIRATLRQYLKIVLLGVVVGVITNLSQYIAGGFGMIPAALFGGGVLGLLCAVWNRGNWVVNVAVGVSSAVATMFAIPAIEYFWEGTLSSVPIEWGQLPINALIEYVFFGLPAVVMYGLMTVLRRQ